MIQQVEDLTSQALSELEPLAEQEALEKWRVSYLGRKGSLTQMLRGVSSLPVEERREAGVGGEPGQEENSKGRSRRKRSP